MNSACLFHQGSFKAAVVTQAKPEVLRNTLTLIDTGGSLRDPSIETGSARALQVSYDVFKVEIH